MKQADYFAGRWNTRREFEWRFLISLWTLLVVGAGFLTGKGQPWSSSCSCVQYLADLVKIGVPVYLHWRWLRGVFGANDYDKKKAHAFQHKAERTILPTRWLLDERRAQYTFRYSWRVFLS